MGFVNIDKVLYSSRVNTPERLNGTAKLMRSDLQELAPRGYVEKDGRSNAPRKGMARCELTVGRTNKKTGRATVHGKERSSNHLYGWLVYDSIRRVWHFQLVKWKFPSGLAFGSKKAAAIAMGKCL